MTPYDWPLVCLEGEDWRMFHLASLSESLNEDWKPLDPSLTLVETFD